MNSSQGNNPPSPITSTIMGTLENLITQMSQLQQVEGLQKSNEDWKKWKEKEQDEKSQPLFFMTRISMM